MQLFSLLLKEQNIRPPPSGRPPPSAETQWPELQRPLTRPVRPHCPRLGLGAPKLSARRPPRAMAGAAAPPGDQVGPPRSSGGNARSLGLRARGAHRCRAPKSRPARCGWCHRPMWYQIESRSCDFRSWTVPCFHLSFVPEVTEVLRDVQTWGNRTALAKAQTTMGPLAGCTVPREGPGNSEVLSVPFLE